MQCCSMTVAPRSSALHCSPACLAPPLLQSKFSGSLRPLAQQARAAQGPVLWRLP